MKEKAVIQTTVYTTAGKGDDMKSAEQQTLDIGEETLLVKKDKGMEVKIGIGKKVSDSTYWGSGTWDKVPYSVEVYVEVKMRCEQNSEEFKNTSEIAASLAQKHSRDVLEKSVLAHVNQIETVLYKELFE